MYKSLIFVHVAVLITATYGSRILLLGPSVHFSSHQVEPLSLGEQLVTRGYEVYRSIATFGSCESEANNSPRPTSP